MSVNLSNTTPAAPAGSVNAKFATDGAGNVSVSVSKYAVEQTGFDATAQMANIASTPLVTTPPTGRYRISAYVVVTTAATTSSTMPKVTVSWNDADSGQAQSLDITVTSTGNALTTFSQGSVLLSANVSANIAFVTSGYASVGATAMQYAVHITVESL